MRLIRRRPQHCDRAREWISRELDHDLSELEGSMLSGHLAQCAKCHAFRDDALTFTSALRLAPLQELAQPIVLPRAHRFTLRPAQVAAALAIAAVGAGSLFGSLQSRNSGSPGFARTRVNVEREMQAQKGFQFRQREIAFNAGSLAAHAKHGGPQVV